VCRSSVVNK